MIIEMELETKTKSRRDDIIYITLSGLEKLGIAVFLQ